MPLKSNSFRIISPLVLATFFLFFLGLSLHSEPTQAASGIIYVNHAAMGSNNGITWTHAYQDLQDALGTATAGNEIWVASGVYTPGQLRTDSFVLTNGVAIYGGFAATETVRSQRDWKANITVLSGDIDENDTADENGVVQKTDDITGSNSYHIIQNNNIDNSALLDGFTITAGNADGNSPHNTGAGMKNEEGSPTLTNLIFSANRATVGGAMFNRTRSSPIISRTQFIANSATEGGAIYSDPNSDPDISDSTFTKNIATRGGAISNFANVPTIARSTFSGNEATQAGGAIYNDLSCLTLTDSTFSGNVSWPEGTGGAIYNYESCITVQRTQFTRNIAGYGGGVYFENSLHDILVNVTFAGQEVGFEGGAIYVKKSTPRLVNNLIISNIAQQGAAIFNEDGSTTELINSTISGNMADFGAGGIQNLLASMHITNSIIWNNHGKDGVDTGSITNQASPTVTVESSLIQGSGGSTNWNNDSGIDRGGNLDADPLFTEPKNPSFFPRTDGDYRLMANSPAVNAGSDFTFSATDLAGNQRIQASTIDMGAYELPYYTLSLDLTEPTHGEVTGTSQICTADCNESYPLGSVITLTAIPDDGYLFTGWSGGCSGIGVCVVTMSADRSIKASFADRFTIFLPLVTVPD
ncbi:MAG: hypothetical protein ACI9EW_003213 [Cellvibrionaceae bacterium]|jgi:hypothetical protein